MLDSAYMSIQQTADQFGASTSTVYRWARENWLTVTVVTFNFPAQLGLNLAPMHRYFVHRSVVLNLMNEGRTHFPSKLPKHWPGLLAKAARRSELPPLATEIVQ